MKSRSNKSAKQAGTRFERTLADYLAQQLDDRVDRRPRTGAKDRGDIGGVRLSPALHSGRVVIECKDWARLALAAWAGQAEAERGNDDAVAGVVVHKRHGVADPADQWVTCTVRDFVALLTGERPSDDLQT